jgi:hypothetical protein
MILVGVDEDPTTGAAVVPICGIALKPGLRERVIQKASDAIYPPIIPEVRVVEFKSDQSAASPDRAVVVIRVPESDLGSHAVENRRTVYLRIDNTSDPIRKASIEELEWFRNKREPAMQLKERVLERARERATLHFQYVRNRYQLPTSLPSGCFRLWTTPAFPRSRLTSEMDLREAVRDALDFFPYLPSTPGAPTPIAEGVYFEDHDNKKFKYQEASIHGPIYHEIGFWWDESDNTIVSVGAVVNTMASSLKFALQTYERLGYFGIVEFQFEMHGVRGRRLAEPSQLDSTAPCRDDEVVFKARGTLKELSIGCFDVIENMLREVYWAFGTDIPPHVLSKILLNCPLLLTTG